MYVFLSTLGAVVVGAGLALLASDAFFKGHALDPTNLTPSTIVIVGGCILIGLALVVRALVRVERALGTRSMPRPARQGERADAAATESEAAPIPSPTKPKATAQPSAAGTDAGAPLEGASQASSAPSSGRVEHVAVTAGSEASLPTTAATRSEESDVEAKHATATRINGAAQAAPQVAAGSARVSQQQTKSAMFDALWPKTRHAAVSENHGAPAAQPTPAEPSPQSAGAAALGLSARSAATQQPAQAVSILKSGVVEGMAYTLYSDGSIEATLPGGTLRFNSITDLRNHIEQNG
jgi:hypothetical protein